ncbi:hypothetical protein BCR37DRAFT_376765 [Protomyces lactucae-debilis]|uniref:Uncharacterized protein n=1 Tax=Protomyces lactucae-debilis TaxID=2754530 RepID=A0A1Y2FSP9_PROLT|nr:uncharacterized protein BCR37DRAFT_376765 [Protomyces lactucae-debilis]ORY86216.1 hypothetical protein BCR37DRAFT_376765 [Protomyces lactucae-debilis]
MVTSMQSHSRAAPTDTHNNSSHRTAPLSIPRRASQSDRITMLLAETAIKPRRQSSKRRSSMQSALSSSSSTASLCSLHSMPATPPASQARTVPRPHSKRRSSLFDECDGATNLETPVAASFSYLLTPPDSLPSLSRSCSSDSMESNDSVSSSPSVRRRRRLSALPSHPVNLDMENPLLVDEEADFFSSSNASDAQSPQRVSALSVLFKPLTSVGPSIRTSSFVSSLSANLSAWATSLSAAQFDHANLLVSRSRSHHGQPVSSGSRQSRPYTAAGLLPRAKQQASNPQDASLDNELKNAPLATSTEAQMEKEVVDDVLWLIELQPWQDISRESQVSPPQATTRRMRPREPRLNPDFLRILVLEQNMCRVGKMCGTSGYTRMILAAREDDADVLSRRRGSLRQAMVMDSC